MKSLKITCSPHKLQKKLYLRLKGILSALKVLFTQLLGGDLVTTKLMHTAFIEGYT